MARATVLPDDPWTTRAPGTYLLLLRLDRARQIQVGRLGQIACPAGWYVYVGSALGGLGARLRRHARADKPRHWHVDALRAVTSLAAVGVRLGPERVECEIAATVAALPGATRPAARFGSSDCCCPAHLFHFVEPPDLHLDPRWRLVPLGGHRHGAGVPVGAVAVPLDEGEAGLGESGSSAGTAP